MTEDSKRYLLTLVSAKVVEEFAKARQNEPNDLYDALEAEIELKQELGILPKKEVSANLEPLGDVDEELYQRRENRA